MSSYSSLLRQQTSRPGTPQSANSKQKHQTAQRFGQPVAPNDPSAGTHHVTRARRFQISRRGTLSYQDHRFAGLVQDISEKGMLLVCNYDLDVGLELDVDFELETGSRFYGRIRVRHFQDGCFGAEVVEAEGESQRNWARFLATHYSGQPGLPERRTRM